MDMVLANELQNLTEVVREFTQAKLLGRPRARLEKDIELMFKAQQKIMLKGFALFKDQFEESVTARDLESIVGIAEEKTKDRAEDAVEKAARAGLLSGSKALISELNIGMSFNLANPRAVSYLNLYGAKQVTKINETTRSYIQSIVKQSADEGWSYNRTAKAIGERYEKMWIGKPQEHIASRAHFIAVTETGNAYMEGQFAMGHELMAQGLPMEKYWSTMRDDRVSDGCRENEDKGWIDLAFAFPSGHMRPLRFPGCRCDMLQRVAEKRVIGEPPPTGLQHAPNQGQVNSATNYAEESSKAHANRLGVDHDDYMRQSEENFQSFLDDNPIAVRADVHNGMNIVEDGRFKTQFETNTSNGTLDQGFRASAENKGFGMPKDLDPTERPIYGYVSHIDQPEIISQYGDLEFVLKDAVKDRTTVTAGDSLYNAELNQVVGTPAKQVSRAGMDGEVEQIFVNSFDEITYVEAQIQGGVAMADVDHLILHYNYEMAEKEVEGVLKWFKDRGLKVIYDPEGYAP